MDRVALGVNVVNSLKGKIMDFFYPNPTWELQKSLRKLEYYQNCKKGTLNKIYYLYLQYLFRRKSISLGVIIPENVFGPGLAIAHYGTIIVNHNARVGKNCRIQAGVNIGASGGDDKAPLIGDNVYIGPGAIIFGDIRIGNNVAIGANSTVNKTFDENNILIAGSPAKRIKEYDITKIIKHVSK